MSLLDLCFHIWLPLAFGEGVPEPEPIEIRISPQTTRIEAPLGFDGRIDYTAYLNLVNSRGVAPAENSAVLYWRAIGRQSNMPESYCREVERLMGAPLFDETKPKMVSESEFAAELIESKQIGSLNEFYNLQAAASAGPWQAERFPLVEAWLKRNEPTLELVEQGGALPKYYVPLPHTRLLLESPLFAIQHYRVLIRMLQCRVMLRAGEEDYEGAARDLITMFRLAAKTGQGSTLIDGLLGCAFYAISESVLERFVTRTEVSEEILTRLQAELSTLPPNFELIAVAMEYERYSALDAIQYAATQDPATFLTLLSVFPAQLEDGWRGVRDQFLFALYQQNMNSRIDWNVVLTDTNQLYDQLAGAYGQLTYAERKAALERSHRQIEQMQQQAMSLTATGVSAWLPKTRERQVQRLIASMFLSGLGQIHEAGSRGEVRRRVSPLGCAIERYRRVNGSYPPNLSSLVPDFIDELPLDPYTDKPFHYRVNGDRSQFAVFTFGPNQKDDRGATWGEGGDDMGMHSPGWLAAAAETLN